MVPPSVFAADEPRDPGSAPAACTLLNISFFVLQVVRYGCNVSLYVFVPGFMYSTGSGKNHTNYHQKTGPTAIYILQIRNPLDILE